MTYYRISIFLIIIINTFSTILLSQPSFGDKVNVKVSAKVEMNENYSYSYDVLVSSESDQALVAFTIEIKTKGKKNSENLIINNPVNSNWGGSILMPTVKPESFKGSEITWVPLDTLEYYSDQFLMPNSSIKQGDSINFSFESKGLPIIARFWCLGWYKPITVSEYDSLKATGFEESDILKPWYLNAKQGYTVSSSAIPNPFIPLDFIDTLITYTDSSYVLSWIKDEQTRDKYDNYFSNAKNYLNQNNNNAAKSELQKVLTDCNADSSSVLTSEAYALLYFNTDYLIKQIPEREPGLPVKLEDSQGSLLRGGSKAIADYVNKENNYKKDEKDKNWTAGFERTFAIGLYGYNHGFHKNDNKRYTQEEYGYDVLKRAQKFLPSN